jgi:gliding-associated putative ABC transporter substrate-binding component GldG
MASETETENGKASDGKPAAPAADTAEKKMGRRKALTASNATAYVLLTVGAVVLINLIGTRVFGRVDLTENHVYTLAPGSKAVVANLPDYLTVKAYMSDEMPPEMKQVSVYVRDLLDEYRTYSKGKLRFEVINPTDKAAEDEAAQCKVQKLQVQVMRQQKFEVGAYYLGLCFQYQGKDEAIPQAAPIEGLEYRVSSLLKRMTQKKQKIAITNGHGESELGYLKHIEEFEVTNVNPSSAPIPDDVDAIIVPGPKQPFDDKGRHEIDAFLMKGRGAIFMIDGMAMQSPRAQGMPPEMMGAQPKIGQPNDTGLGELLEKYGFKVNPDFVLDTPRVPALIDLPDGRKMLGSLPVYVGVKTTEDKDFSVLDHITAMVFPFGSSVDLVGPLASGKPPAGKLWTIAKTMPTAWKHTGMFFFSPTAKIEEGKEKGSFGMGYAYQGPLKSAYPSPAAQTGMSTPDQANTPPSESKKPARLLVIGDSDFASEEYLQLGRTFPIWSEGVQMLVNGMGWATEDESLTPVRTKTLTARPIEASSTGTVYALQFLNVIGVPLAFVAFGIVRWRIRGARRQGLKL